MEFGDSEKITAMALDIAKEAGFYRCWLEYSSTPGVDHADNYEWLFMGYGLKIVYSMKEGSHCFCLEIEYKGRKVYDLSSGGKNYSKEFDADWIDMFCLIYDKLPLLSEVKKLCDDWCKYVKRGYKSDSLRVVYFEKLKDYEGDGVHHIVSNRQIVYDRVRNVSIIGDWMQEMRCVINDTIAKKKRKAFLQKIANERQDDRYRQILSDL